MLRNEPVEVRMIAFPDDGATKLYQTVFALLGVIQHAGTGGSPLPPEQLLSPVTELPIGIIIALHGKSFATAFP